MVDPQLVLKTTPPRAPRSVLPRERLARLWAEIRDRTAISVCAPGGFGKTMLLVQWRRLWLEQGALVGWLALDNQDDPPRFARGLFHAMRVASGRVAFDTAARQHAEQPDRGHDALTGLLAEIASLATPTVLLLDDAERLPEATARETLAYVLFNAPSNLHVVIGSRVPLPLPTWDLAAHGNYAAVKAQELRLELDESIAILRNRFGQRLSLDDCARMHEATEGWPIGLQLAAASVERAADPHAAIESLSARTGDLERYFIESLLSRLPAPVADFLTRISILDDIDPEACEAVTGCASAAAYLDQLARDTPILIVAELRDWTRMHPLARDFLVGRFEKLAAAERKELHLRAARWLAERQRFHEAGRHALAGGDETLARACAKRGLWELVTRGRLAEAREWLARLPPDAFEGDVRLRVAAGWIMALGERPEEALEIADQIANAPGVRPETQYEAALVAGCAAAYSDRVGRIESILERWAEPPMDRVDPILAAAHANTKAIVALHRGATEQVRELEMPVPIQPQNDTLLMGLALGRMLVGLSHLWDGNAYKAEAALRPALVQAERDFGRRSVPAALYAGCLAAALFERDEPDGAQALLANRLDVIERHAPPDVVLLAYRTLAYVALAQNDERRALEILDDLHALGEAWRMPRLTLLPVVERIRVHALRSRSETVAGLVATLEAMAKVFASPDYRPFLPQYQLQAAIARAYADASRSDLDATERHLDAAHALAMRLHRGRDLLAVKVLRAVVARQRDDPKAMQLLSEALGLAAIGGNDRLLADTHPVAARMGRELEGASAPAAPLARAASAEKPERRPAASTKSAVLPGGLLTPKEAEVLRLLNGGLSNKLIARTMDVGDETVKWHLKNLFSKLSAGTRKHAVDRARMLGLVSD